MPFQSDLIVQELGPHRWEVREELKYQGSHEPLSVPAGKETDFASVPKQLRWLVPKYGVYNKAAVLHDHLCKLAEKDEFDRSDADGIFRRSMRELGVGYIRRWVMWAAVRLGGKLRGADWKEAARVILIALPVAVVAVPGMIVAQVLIWTYQLLELLVYAVRRGWSEVRPGELTEAVPRPTPYWSDQASARSTGMDREYELTKTAA